MFVSTAKIYLQCELQRAFTDVGTSTSVCEYEQAFARRRLTKPSTSQTKFRSASSFWLPSICKCKNTIVPHINKRPWILEN